MKTRTGFSLGVLLIMNNLLIAQDNPSFYVEIPDNKNIPAVTHNSRGKRIVYSNSKNIALDKLINSSELYRCNHVFNRSTPAALQNIYLILTTLILSPKQERQNNGSHLCVFSIKREKVTQDTLWYGGIVH